MSAESKVSQLSVDEILASIREIIAEEEREAASPRDQEGKKERPVGADESGQVVSELARALGGGADVGDVRDAGEGVTDSEAGEEVFELSEEFIVSASAQAVREEFERFAATSGRGTPAREFSESAEELLQAESQSEPEEDAGEKGAHMDETGEGQAGNESWEHGYQMPIPESGPSAPFLGTAEAPRGSSPHFHFQEEAGQPGEPFDVGESYKRARAGYASTIPEALRQEPAQSARKKEQAQEGRAGDAVPPADDGFEPAQASGDAKDASAPSGGAVLPTGTAPLGLHAEGVTLTPPSEDVKQPSPLLNDGGNVGPESEALGARRSGESEEEADEPGGEWGAHQLSRKKPPTASAQPGEQHEAEPPPAQDEPTPAAAAEADVGVALPGVQDDGAQDAISGAPLMQAAASEGQTAAPRGQPTLEESVKELLRPMLSKWLDENMPKLVKEAIREEIRKKGSA